MNKLVSLCFGIIVLTSCSSINEYQIRPAGISGELYEVFDGGTEVAVDFIHYPGKRLYTADVYVRTERRYKEVRIKEVSFVTEGKKYYLVRNKKVELDMAVGTNGLYYDYVFDTGIQADIKRRFKKMGAGEKQNLELLCVYAFDGEPARENRKQYIVERFPGNSEKP
jgi:hypothetical protein